MMGVCIRQRRKGWGGEGVALESCDGDYVQQDFLGFGVAD